MDLLMKTRLKLITRELSNHLIEGSFTRFWIEYNDPAETKDKLHYCVKIELANISVSQCLLLSWTTRDTWIFAVQHMIAEFIRETRGDLFDEPEE